MDETKTSLLMKFERESKAVEAECPLVVFRDDKIATASNIVRLKDSSVSVPGFQHSSSEAVSRYFLISAFNFAASLASGESRAANAAAAAAAAAAAHLHADDRKKAAAAKPASNEFAGWRRNDPNWNKAESAQQGNPFSGHIDDFSFTRLIDRATPALMNSCCKGTTFKSASLIKRKPSQSGDPKQPVKDFAYLRIDFAGVKITSLDWEDGDVLEETCKFTCDGMLVSYAMQDPAGTLAPSSAVLWNNPMADTSKRSNA